VGLTTAGTPYYRESGIPFLRGENVYEQRLDLSSLLYVPLEKHNEWTSSQVLPGNIIINLVGNVGDACIAPSTLPAAQINRALGRIVSNELASNEFLELFLNSELGRLQMLRYSQGGMQKRFNTPDGRHICIPLPKNDEQTAIVNRYKRLCDLTTRIHRAATSLTEQRQEVLAGILSYIGAQVGLTQFPSPWFGRVYLLETEDIDDRLDVLGANPEFAKACGSSGKFVRLDSVCRISSADERLAPGRRPYLAIDELPKAHWGDISVPLHEFGSECHRSSESE
jgi:hypothetical protein